MINVEGEYDDIIKWIDDNKPFNRIEWTAHHGVFETNSETSKQFRLNVGLFSICEDNYNTSTSIYTYDSSRDAVPFYSEKGFVYWMPVVDTGKSMLDSVDESELQTV